MLLLLCREKDGLWAVLAWLSILAYVNRDENRNLLQQVAHKAPGLSWLQSLAFIPSFLVFVGFTAREGAPSWRPAARVHIAAATNAAAAEMAARSRPNSSWPLNIAQALAFVRIDNMFSVSVLSTQGCTCRAAARSRRRSW